MTVIVGFTIILMVSLLAYMSYRLFLRRKLELLAVMVFQIIALTTAILSFYGGVQTSNLIEAFYVILGIMVPGGLFVFDYIIMIKKVKKQGVYEGLVQPLQRTAEDDASANADYLRPIIKERPVIDIVKDINLNKDDFVKNIKKSLTQAQLYINNKDYENAYEIYQPIAALIRNCPGLLFNYGNLCYYLQKYSEASQSYKKVLEINEKQIENMEKESSLISVHNMKELSIDSKPDQTNYEIFMVYYNLGNVQFKLNRFEQAIESYKKSLELNPLLEDANENTARALVMLGRTDEALQYYRNIVETDSKNYNVHYKLASLYFDNKKYDEAADAVRQCLAIKADCDEGIELLARIYLKSGKNPEAIEEYLKLIKLRPDDYSVYNSIGAIYYQLDQKMEAVEAYKKAVELNSRNFKGYYNLAVALDDLSLQDEAIEAFKNVIELKSDFIEAYNNLGILLSTQDRHMEALDIYVRGLKKNPEEYSLYYNMGVTLSEMERYDEAAEAFKSALEIKPDEYEICYHLGAALTELKQYDEAANVYKTAMKYKPEDSELYYNIAVIYALLKKNTIAFDNLKKAIELNSEYKLEAKGNKIFNSLKRMEGFKEMVS